MWRLAMADPALKASLTSALQAVQERIAHACTRRSPTLNFGSPRLVAASKTKPPGMVAAAYEAGQRHFGENYIQELEDKSNSEEVQNFCPDIKWHYIGQVQRNKINKLVGVPNLYMVQTVHSSGIADKLNSAWHKRYPDDALRVMVQVNTSREEQKGGVFPGAETVELVDHVKKKCPFLVFCGLMTIGALNHDPSRSINPDFVELTKCRAAVCDALGLPLADVELSMGMSGDFEQAIEQGSMNVRVGSTIFGARAKPQSSGDKSNTPSGDGGMSGDSQDRLVETSAAKPSAEGCLEDDQGEVEEKLRELSVA